MRVRTEGCAVKAEGKTWCVGRGGVREGANSFADRRRKLKTQSKP